ncbi:MAG TPA: PadR family transcriptional regulator [Cyclobacteriaceae bacterium]
MKGTSLGEFEELCLLAVAVLQDDAYGVSIKEEIDHRTRRNTTISTIHSTLIRLERKGFLKSKMGGATDERGGRAKRLFEITAFGKKAINEARILRNNMWKDIPDLLWKGGPL